MKKIKLEVNGLFPSQTNVGSTLVFLKEQDGSRRIPVIIGNHEAQAITMILENYQPKRPMTHDLFQKFAENFHFSLEEVVITEFKEAIFYAKIICTNGVEIDSRTSDAIALALRFDVPIFTNITVINEVGITESELQKADNLEEEFENEESGKPTTLIEQLKASKTVDLNNMLDNALQNEEYELAAKIRDELSKRN